jgi:hypothetical protein
MPPTPVRAEVARSPAEALGMAMQAPSTPIIGVAGSLFLVGDVLTLLRGEPDKPCSIEKGADSIERLFS